MIQDCDTLDLIWLNTTGETAPAILQHSMMQSTQYGYQNLTIPYRLHDLLPRQVI